MKRRLRQLLDLGLSGTAKTTYAMFAGNATTAVFAFVVVILTARVLGPVRFGLFFALYNVVQLVSSVADLGVNSGLVNFIPASLSQGNPKEANQYLKAGWDFVLFISIVLTIVGLLAPLGVVSHFLPGVSTGEWFITVFCSTTFILVNFVIFAFQARKEFNRSIIANVGYSSSRTLFIFILALLGKLTVLTTVGMYTLSSLLGTILSLPFLPKVFSRENKPTKDQTKKLLSFSAHLGLGRIAANIASRVDVGLLYPLAGAVATAQYGIAQRVAFLYILFSASAAAVVTPKIASLSSRQEMKRYAKKMIVLTILLLASLFAGIIAADPFIRILFGSKYIAAIPVTQWLLLANIPFILTFVPTNIVIYYQKNSKLIGILSVIQLGIVVALNLTLIPTIGVFGPVVAYAVGNTFVALITWYQIKGIVV